MDIETRGTSIMVDPAVVYETISHVVDSRKRDQITWFVGTLFIETQSVKCQVRDFFMLYQSRLIFTCR